MNKKFYYSFMIFCFMSLTMSSYSQEIKTCTCLEQPINSLAAYFEYFSIEKRYQPALVVKTYSNNDKKLKISKSIYLEEDNIFYTKKNCLKKLESLSECQEREIER